MSTWVWLSRRVGREVLKKFMEYIQHVEEVTHALLEMLESIKAGDLERAKKLFEKAYEEEKTADDLKRGILRDLARGVIHPMDREDIMRLVLTTDDVAGYAKAAARRIKIMLDLGFNIDADVLDLLIEMARKVNDAAELIRVGAAQLIRNPNEALNTADKIERLEEEVDEIRLVALEKMYSKCGKYPTAQCLLMKEVIDSIEGASDKCEDVCDVIRAIALTTL